jgi:hypothetical protein
MARIGSALLALMLALAMCGTTFAAGKKDHQGKASKGPKTGKHHKKS